MNQYISLQFLNQLVLTHFSPRNSLCLKHPTASNQVKEFSMKKWVTPSSFLNVTLRRSKNFFESIHDLCKFNRLERVQMTCHDLKFKLQDFGIDSGLESKDLKLTCDLQNNGFVPPQTLT